MKLYHYCSNTCFHSIIANRSLRLSSLVLSNDSLEGKLVAELLLEMARADNLDAQAIDGLGFCLSEEGDLLSQWRGYADDAAGVSIGFSKQYLEQLSNAVRDPNEWGFTLQQVVYDRDKQAELLRPTYDQIKDLIDKGAFKTPGRRTLLDFRTEEQRKEDDASTLTAYRELGMHILPLFAKLFLLKCHAFSEEHEWRLLSYFFGVGNDKCFFYPSRTALKPCREFALKDLGSIAIEEVVLGPKNATSVRIVEAFLKQNGFVDTNIVRSAASYR